MKNIPLILSLSVVLISCGKNTKTGQVPLDQSNDRVVILTSKQYKNAGIETGKLSPQTISSVLKVNGKIDVPPQNMISISVPLGGYLKSTKLLAGMHIIKGEVLAVMEDAQYIQLQQDYLTAKAQFILTEGEYKRQKELNQSKATSDKIYEQSKANFQMQFILIKSLEEKLKLLGLNPQNVTAKNISKSINIYSPITGFVSAVNVNIGKYVNPSDVLFELVNPSDIHLALTVFEKDINKLAIGQKLVAYTNSNPDKKYPCKIILISKIISNQNSAEVHCHFEQYDNSLLPGMFMTTDIELLANKANTLPEEAVVRFENKHYVFMVKENNQFEMMEVQIGNTENGNTEIADADNLSNQTFVLKGAYTLLMAMKNKSDE